MGSKTPPPLENHCNQRTWEGLTHVRAPSTGRSQGGHGTRVWPIPHSLPGREEADDCTWSSYCSGPAAVTASFPFPPPVRPQDVSPTTPLGTGLSHSVRSAKRGSASAPGHSGIPGKFGHVCDQNPNENGMLTLGHPPRLQPKGLVNNSAAFTQVPTSFCLK